MTLRPLKTLALLACSLVALLGISATSAGAANFTASSYPAAVTGESVTGPPEGEAEIIFSENDVFELGIPFSCGSHFTGSLSGVSSTLEVVASFTRCHVGLAAVEINMTGCRFLYHLGETIDLVCPTGKAVDVNIPALKCAMTIPPQNGLASVDYPNWVEGVLEVRATGTKAIQYTVTKDELFCPQMGTGPKTGGDYRQGEPIELAGLGGATVHIG